jgi:hypothetical protein
MITKGQFIYWEMSEVKTNKAMLEDLGFGDFVPRNDYKTALIKALKSYTKGNEKLYRRFNDFKDSVAFSVFIEQASEDDLNLSKEITIKLNKTTGILENAIPEIEEKFRQEMTTIDSTQLRQLILKVLRRNSHAISMRSGGGIYFVDNRFAESLQPLESLFQAIEGAKLYKIPVYNESATLEAIEDATASEIFSDIETVIQDITREFNNGNLTEKRLTTKMDEADQILKKVKLHEENLRSRASQVSNRVKRLQDSLKITTSKIASGVEAEESFLTSLQDL